jgi:hypothetical protein
MNEILRDRVLVDLIRQLDTVARDFERARDHELSSRRMLIDNALRAATDYLLELREERRGQS